MRTVGAVRVAAFWCRLLALRLELGEAFGEDVRGMYGGRTGRLVVTLERFVLGSPSFGNVRQNWQNVFRIFQVSAKMRS